MAIDSQAMMVLVDQYMPSASAHKWFADLHDYIERPGTVNNEGLKIIAIQYGARFKFWRRIKNYIYAVEGTRQIVYKKRGAPMWVIRMGISHKKRGIFRRSFRVHHPKAVSEVEYARIFLDGLEDDKAWLKRNRYVLLHNKDL